MELHQLKPCTNSEQVRPLTSSGPCSFSNRFLCQILQLRFVKYLLKMFQKASIWIGFVLPVETMVSKLHPTQSPPRPGRLARKRRGRLVRLLLSMAPTSIQNILGSLPADWGQSNQPREIREALINPTTKASKRKRDDVALEKQKAWFVVLERDLPEDDSEDLTYEPSEEELDSAEYQSQNDTAEDLELEERGGIIMLKESFDLQGCDLTLSLLCKQGIHNPQDFKVSLELPAPRTEPGQEDPAGSGSGEDSPDVDSGDGDAQKPQADWSSEDGSGQETDTDSDDSSSLS